MKKVIYREQNCSRPVILEPITNVPALEMKGDERWVCVADLHLGIEVRLRAGGFNIPSQTSKMLEALLAIRDRGDNLIILGDLKHRIPSIGYHENKEIGPFLERLGGAFDRIVIAAGNHDGGLSSVIPEGIRAVSGHGCRIEDIGAAHGHVWPSEEAMASDTLIMGHIHPSVMFRDSLGTKSNEKCWVRAKLSKRLVEERYQHCPKELVVMPAFNPLLTGTPINAVGGAMLGPVFRNRFVDEKSLRAYLLDGTDLGHPRKV